MSKPHVFRIDVDPLGARSRVEMDGAPLRNVCAFDIRAGVTGPSRLVLEFVGVSVEVGGAFGEVAWQLRQLPPLPDEEK